MAFKNIPFENRLEQFNKINYKYPDRVPIIVTKNKHCVYDDIDKDKFLVEKNMIFCQFINVIRKRLKMSSEKALYITINGNLAPSNDTIGSIYLRYKENDGFLYMEYSMENTFG